MASYLKDKKAYVYKKTDGYQDEYGIWHKGGYAKVGYLWCYTRMLSQSLTYDAKVAGTDETRLFVFNWNEEIKPYTYVYYKGTWYQVTRTDTTNDYKGDVYTYVQDCPAGDKPNITPQ